LLILNVAGWAAIYCLISQKSAELNKRDQELKRDIKIIREVYGQALKIREREKKYNNVDEETGKEIAYTIIYAARRHNLKTDLIAAMVETESSFRPKARSDKNARSLMQMTKLAWQDHGQGNIDDWFDNLIGGANYVAHLKKRFDGDESLAVAAYYAGPSRPPGTILRKAAHYLARVNRYRWEMKA
jgi:soluble lytic murein transglycosylase-like protein